MTYFFFTLGNSANCVERPNECYFAKEWNFTVDLGQIEFFTYSANLSLP